MILKKPSEKSFISLSGRSPWTHSVILWILIQGASFNITAGNTVEEIYWALKITRGIKLVYILWTRGQSSFWCSCWWQCRTLLCSCLVVDPEPGHFHQSQLLRSSDLKRSRCAQGTLPEPEDVLFGFLDNTCIVPAAVRCKGIEGMQTGHCIYHRVQLSERSRNGGDDQKIILERINCESGQGEGGSDRWYFRTLN